jgi:adenylosuccinate synthase
MINGFTALAITKLDVLTGMDELKVCTHYRYGGRETHRFASEAQTLSQAEPVYVSFPGWKEDLTTAQHVEDLPTEARHYLQFIARELDVPIHMVSTGPKREQTLTGEAGMVLA